MAAEANTAAVDVAQQRAIIRLLVQQSFATDAVDSLKRTPLLAAYEQHNAEAAQLLLELLPAPDRPKALLHSDRWGKTALHYAARHAGDVRQVESCVRSMGRQAWQLLLATDNRGCTALHAAAAYRSVDLVKALLAAGRQQVKPGR